MLFQPRHAASATPAATSTMTSSTIESALRTAIKIILQDDGRRRGVELGLSRTPVFVPHGEPAFRFPARQPLVLQRDGKRRLRFEAPGELLDTRRHVIWRSIESSRQADHNRADAVLFRRKPGDFPRDHVERVELEARRTQHTEGARERAGEIADGDPDPFFADIEPHHAHAVTLY